MAKKTYTLFNKDVTEYASRLKKLEKYGYSFDSLLRELEEEEKKKKNFAEIFVRIFNEHLEKVMKVQAQAISNGLSDEPLADVVKNYIDVMKKIENVCVEANVLKQPVLKEVINEDKIKKSMSEILGAEFDKKKDDNKAQEKYKDELKKVAEFKLANDEVKIKSPKEFVADTVLKIAEKKFGKFSNATKDKINEYIKRFDIKNKECRDDLKEFAEMDVLTENQQNTQTQNQMAKPYQFDLRQFPLEIFMKDLYKDLKAYEHHNMSVSYQWYLASFFFAEQSIVSSKPIEEIEDCPEEIDEFYQKYGFVLNKDLLADLVIEADSFGEGKEIFYKKMYMETFVRVFNHVDGGYKKIKGLLEDFEHIMQGVIKGYAPALEDKKYRYGGMTTPEMKSFLLALTERDCNLTQRNKAELVEKCSKANVVQVDDAIKFSKEKIDNEINSNVSNEEKFVNSIARLSALQQIHAERSTLFKVMHPVLYNKEAVAIVELKQTTMNIAFELSENMMSQELKDGLEGKDVYKFGYSQAKNEINTMSIEPDVRVNIDLHTELANDTEVKGSETNIVKSVEDVKLEVANENEKIAEPELKLDDKVLNLKK